MVDFYFNSWRLVPANVIWGIGLLIVIVLSLVAPVVALFALVPLALPTAGIFRLAALIARDEPVSFVDALTAWREAGVRALAVGALIVTALTVLTFNALVGAASRDVFGWVFATLAVWGLVIVVSGSLAIWPLMLDPLRSDLPPRAIASLAVAVVFSSPLRYGLLVSLVALFLVVSTVAFAALVTISISLAALVLCRYVLPAADRLEKRATKPVPEAPDSA